MSQSSEDFSSEIFSDFIKSNSYTARYTSLAGHIACSGMDGLHTILRNGLQLISIEYLFFNK